MRLDPRSLAALVLVPLLAGCAGGWRGGSPPAEWASGTGAGTGTGTKAAAAPARAAATGAAGTLATADGVTFVWTGEGATVHVAGDFNAWSTSADALARQPDGSWRLPKKLAAGRYAYKFVVDGTNWKPDPGVSEGVDDGFGGKNSLIVVGGAAGGAAGGTAAPAAEAGTAAPAAKPAEVPATVRALAPGAAPRAPQLTGAGVVFTYAGPAKSGVALCGDFNSWATTADRMAQGADGTWTITRKLAAGAHAYKFLVDGAAWKQDDGNSESKDDGFGGKNSIVVVK